MDVIAVLDLKNGAVVHGQAGNREQYQIIKSQILDSKPPTANNIVASCIKKLSITNFYIADLDAIEDQGNNFNTVLELANNFPQATFMLDAGFNKLDTAKKFLKAGLNIIIATETLKNIDYLNQLSKWKENIILSIDFKSGRFLLDLKKDYTAKEFIIQMKEFGFKKFILLDVGQVGSEKGIKKEIINLANDFSELDLITGGGVRNYQDALNLKKNNFKGVLIATALHKEKISKKNIAALEGRI